MNVLQKSRHCCPPNAPQRLQPITGLAGVGRHARIPRSLVLSSDMNTKRERKLSVTHGRPRSRAVSTVSMHWLFRSNIPRHRGQRLPSDIHKRDLFGLGEIVGVLTNPAETVRSLTESRRLLEEARREISESRERSQLRPTHTFSRFPGFFPRPKENKTIERALEGEPSFTVLFGASSVGKTALLREVLSRPEYHVLHFDLRIAGFADLESLYTSLSQQMELYFEALGNSMDGYEEFVKEGWGFKHDRLGVERRIAETGEKVKVSDVARLMELFQSSLLKYWQFDPTADDSSSFKGHSRRNSSMDTERTHVEAQAQARSSEEQVQAAQPTERTPASEQTQVGAKDKEEGKKRHWFGSRRRNEDKKKGKGKAEEQEKPKEEPKRKKKMPVIFFDEAHKLPALIRSVEAMKCLLDSTLVLTKQDRLCHVIHATSDPFYQTWLRRMNVMQHCRVITIGDCSKAETRVFFHERLLPRVPEQLRPGLNFERLYEAFGGKLTQLQDYVTDYVNTNGKHKIMQSSHFLQAHALLNLHLIHSSESPETEASSPTAVLNGKESAQEPSPKKSQGQGFQIYSPITNPHAAPGEGEGSDPQPDFSAMQLLRVLSRLTQLDGTSLSYFGLCREMGAKAVDGMVKGRILDLRWTQAVTMEGEARVRETIVSKVPGQRETVVEPKEEEGTPRRSVAPGDSGTAIPMIDPEEPEAEADNMDGEEEEEWVAVPTAVEPHFPADMFQEQEHDEEPVGPRLFPLTPIMRYAMAEVVQEYQDVQSISEYASLSDPDEY